MNILLSLVIAVVMLGGGFGHLSAPQNFAGFVPPFLPVGPVIVLSGLVELLIGAAVLWPRIRAKAALAFSALCLCYTPLHVWDFFRPDPVFAPASSAFFRLMLQAAFITAGWWLWHRITRQEKT